MARLRFDADGPALSAAASYDRYGARIYTVRRNGPQEFALAISGLPGPRPHHHHYAPTRALAEAVAQAYEDLEGADNGAMSRLTRAVLIAYGKAV